MIYDLSLTLSLSLSLSPSLYIVRRFAMFSRLTAARADGFGAYGVGGGKEDGPARVTLD